MRGWSNRMIALSAMAMSLDGFGVSPPDDDPGPDLRLLRGW